MFPNKFNFDFPKYSREHGILPVNFNPPYLNLILTEMSIQYHFRNPQAISFPMIPDFPQIDEEKVEFEPF